MVLVSESCVSDWFDDAPKLQCTDTGAGQQGGEQKVVPGTDDNDVIHLLVGLGDHAVAAPARAQDHKPLPSRSAAGNI